MQDSHKEPPEPSGRAEGAQGTAAPAGTSKTPRSWLETLPGTEASAHRAAARRSWQAQPS